jgi:excinuclease UvrABC ATPase subunit
MIKTFHWSQIEFDVCKSNKKRFTENSTEGLCNTCNFTAVPKIYIAVLEPTTVECPVTVNKSDNYSVHGVKLSLVALKHSIYIRTWTSLYMDRTAINFF